MGLAYFRVTPAELDTLQPLIVRHEAELVGPRARGYWFERPDEYDYAGVQADAQALYDAGERYGLDRLELSENDAHSLSMLELELPSDGQEMAPSLFMCSAAPETIKRHLKIARRKLAPTPEAAAERISAPNRDPRFAGYMQKQVRHLRATLPTVWRFYEAAANAGDGVLVVDLRARDLEIPDQVELAAGF